jgi:hypothetical protein
MVSMAFSKAATHSGGGAVGDSLVFSLISTETWGEW